MALPPKWELILCLATRSSLVLVFFSLFWSGFFLHSVFRQSVNISKSLPVPRQRLTQFWRVASEAKGQVKDEWWNKGGLWIQTCTDSVSSLGGWVRAWVWEYSDLVFYLDVLISSCLQALSCDNPDVWRDSCSLQSKEKKNHKNPTPFLGTGLCKAWVTWVFFDITPTAVYPTQKKSRNFSINWMQCSIFSNTARETRLQRRDFPAKNAALCWLNDGARKGEQGRPPPLTLHEA